MGPSRKCWHLGSESLMLVGHSECLGRGLKITDARVPRVGLSFVAHCAPFSPSWRVVRGLWCLNSQEMERPWGFLSLTSAPNQGPSLGALSGRKRPGPQGKDGGPFEQTTCSRAHPRASSGRTAPLPFPLGFGRVTDVPLPPPSRPT